MKHTSGAQHRCLAHRNGCWGVEEKRNAEGDTTLLAATRRGDSVEEVQRLLDLGADVEARSRDGEQARTRDARAGDTALHLAALHGDASVVGALLRAGADKEAPEVFGDTALILAARRGHRGVVQGALHVAASRAHLETVLTLLAAGCQVDARDRHGMTPLHSSAMLGHSRIAEALLHAGADKDAADALQRRPLHLAVLRRHLECARVLLDAGADVETRCSPKGDSPLHLAARTGAVSMVAVLLEAGADKAALNTAGETALDMASSRGDDSFARALGGC
ncbi:ankyrin repeat-containing domain protein [Baffinella frigidus]|nr:ankyrin repeat-containing domain protein [Cryptophyta sp. CCMP2293]